jgi:hypothetical protein
MASQQQPSFLASLGVSPADEKDAVTAQRDALANRVEQSARAQGRTAGRGVAGLLGGAASVLRNRSFRGVGRAITDAHSQATDRDVAESTGITVDQLQGRREIRNLASRGSAEGTFEDRINLARQIANIANRSGDSEVLGAALKRITDLRTEREEFDKLQATTTTQESIAEGSDVVTAFLDGRPVDGTMSQDENGIKGLQVAKPDGTTQFVPWGQRLTRNDPAGGRAPPRSDTELMSSVLGKKEFNSIRSVVTANQSVVRKYDAVLSGLRDAATRGNVQEVVGDAGRTVAFLDNAVRSVRGVLEAFVPGDTFLQDSDLLDQWRGRANAPNAAIWETIQLPEWARASSAQAQNYRAQIIELAYLSARAAEPSNRGLSDNDIKNALRRLGAESANPAVLFRRSMEIVASGANDIDDKLKTYYGSFERRDGSFIEDEKIDQIMGGKSLAAYRQGVNELYDKFDVTILPDGRAAFADAIDVDVNPIPTGDPANPNVLPNISDADFNSALDTLFPSQRQ